MAVANLNKVDDKLKQIYEQQVTTQSSSEPFVDRSDLLFEQMNFIAMANRRALNLI